MGEVMSAKERCPDCGTPLNSEAAPEGFCPECLLKLAMKSSAAGSSDPSKATDSGMTEARSDEQTTSRHIVGFRILEKIGEGGMGEVYRAEQREPIRRKVALKLIKAGMDTKQVVARFESERQALALMSHPNISRVYEAGTTQQGRPYFVMEYVQGVPITEYCDKHRLTTGERLQLFLQVCEGIQHAHQKGIIHRDIKPSNVLVGFEDGKPTPKIIDFGVAKATEQRLTERSVFTQMGMLIGTPEYMSPEQAEMTTLDIDTRTDVYSLGVLLYELLVGALPFEPNALRQVAFDEICRKIREEEPSKPSAKVSTLGGASAESARRRKTDPSSLTRELRGDLDWIIMKALEKDRTRRYPSPSEFAADIGRHLHHEPVVAGRPSARYRAKKFIRRHRVGVGFAALLFLVLAGSTVLLAIQGARIARERDRANEEAITAEEVSEFLVGLFEVSAPNKARGDTITAREVLDRGAVRIEQELADQPIIRGRLEGTIGRVYRQLGLYEQARPLLEQALAKSQEHHGDEHPNTLRALTQLAALHSSQGRQEEAESLYLRVLDARRRVLGHDHPETRSTMASLLGLYTSQGRFEEAEPFLDSFEAEGDRPLAHAYRHEGRFAEAEARYLATLEARRSKLGMDHPSTLSSLGGLATLYREQGRYPEAEPLHLEVVEIKRRVLGHEHMGTLGATTNLAILYTLQRRYAEAEALYDTTLEAQRRILGPDHPQTLRTMNNLANLYEAQGRYAEAEALYQDTLETRRRVRGAEAWSTLRTMSFLGRLYRKQERYDEADPLLSRALESQERALGETHWHTLTTMHELAELHLVQGRLSEAEEVCDRTLSLRLEALGESHPDTLRTTYTLGCIRALQGQTDRALALLRRAIEGGHADLADPHRILEDEVWSSLAGNSEFEAIVAELRRKSRK